MLQFHFWEPVYFATSDVLSYNSSPGFPSDTLEGKGHFVGFGLNVGDALTYKILTDDTQKVIYRSSVRSALNSTQRNLRLDPVEGEPKVIEVVKSPSRSVIHDPDKPASPVGESTGYSRFGKNIVPDDLLNRTFLTEPEHDGQRYRARVKQKIVEREHPSDPESPDNVKFLVSYGNDKSDEIIAYNDVIEQVNREQGFDTDVEPGEQLWKFKAIVGHEGPLHQGMPSYKGSSFNVLVAWEDGSQTFEPLDQIAKDDPVTCAIYAEEKGLLEQSGWRRFKRIASRTKKFQRMINQSKLKSIRRAPIYQFGFRVPRSHAEAMMLDRENGNTKWLDAETTELDQINEYRTFKDLGKGSKAPEGYKRIRVHFVYAVKHDGRHKARLVAGGHLTEIPVESVYS
jgi:hypothetical protein